jgi:hypothetical protein
MTACAAAIRLAPDSTEAEMRSRFATTLGLLSFSLAMSVVSLAYAQIEFTSSTLELKPATEPAVLPPAPNAQVAPEQPAANAADPAPTPTASPENHAVQPTPRPVGHLPTIVEPQFRNRPLVNPYTSASAQTALRKMPQPMQVQSAQSAPARHPARPQGKPFQSNSSEPAISPYLSLYQNNSNQNVLLNYYTVVRPQMDQIESNKKQAAEMQKLRTQVQRATQAGGTQAAMGDPASSEGMTVSAHYMDTAQFYHRIHK